MSLLQLIAKASGPFRPRSVKDIVSSIQEQVDELQQAATVNESIVEEAERIAAHSRLEASKARTIAKRFSDLIAA